MTFVKHQSILKYHQYKDKVISNILLFCISIIFNCANSYWLLLLYCQFCNIFLYFTDNFYFVFFMVSLISLLRLGFYSDRWIEEQTFFRNFLEIFFSILVSLFFLYPYSPIRTKSASLLDRAIDGQRTGGSVKDHNHHHIYRTYLSTLPN